MPQNASIKSAQHLPDPLQIPLDLWPEGLIALNDKGTVCWLSSRATAMLGWCAEEVIGYDIHDLLCLESREFEHSHMNCPLLHTPSAGEQQTHSSCWLSATGEFVNVDYHLIPFSSEQGIKRLISFYKTEQLAFNFSEMEKSSYCIENSTSPIAEFNADGQMSYANPATLRLMQKYAFDEQGRARFLPENLSEICSSCYNNRTGTDCYVEIAGKWLYWHFQPLARAHQTSVMGFAFDVTKRKVTELETQRLNKQARRDYYAKMTHELLTPLTALVGYSTYLLDTPADTHQQRREMALHRIKLIGGQLITMITDTLDASKIETGKMSLQIQPVDVQTILNEIQDQMLFLAEKKHLKYIVECETNLSAQTDGLKVRAILVNLITNAIKFTHKGAVTVTARRTQEQQLQFTVTDTGEGISAAQMHTIFISQESETPHQTFYGIGVGLPLVSELVELLNGEIHVTSTVGIGSSFTVYLPV